jgi:HEAT repeat protein
MIDFLIRYFGYRFDWPEFLLGAITATILLWFLRRLSWLGDIIMQTVSTSSNVLGQKISTSSLDRFRKDLIVRAQQSHLANSLFALDEIAIQPRVLAPNIPVDPKSDEPAPESTLDVLPNLPDWTYLSGVYQAPTISLADALADGANLLITGPLGSGKTTALAYLACRAATREPEVGVAADLTPVFIHASDLSLVQRIYKDALDPLIQAVQHSSGSRLASRIPSYLRPLLRQGNVLLLLDGLDEMSGEEIAAVSKWLQDFQETYPGNRIVAAGPFEGYDGIVHAGLIPIPIAPWTEHTRRSFLARWAEAWQKHIVPTLPTRRMGELDPALLTGWMSGTTRGLTPLEMTMRVWAAYVGDVRGANVLQSFETQLARFLSPDEIQPAASAALVLIREKQSTITERSFGWGTPADFLIEADIFERRAGNRVSFKNPAIGAYLAALALSAEEQEPIGNYFGWLPAETALGYCGAMKGLGDSVAEIFQSADDPTATNLFVVARWLRDIPDRVPWRSQLLHELATIASGKDRPYGLRLRAVHALSRVEDPSIAILFRRLLSSTAYSSRVLGALGLGGCQDEEATTLLIQTIHNDKSVHVKQAACLALASIGTDLAMEGLGKLLLEGQEAVRLAVAEALATHPDEGFNMLRDAMDVENVLTRRAAVFGLARVPEAWASNLLDTVQLEDDQWVVRGAATEAAERKQNPPWKILPAVKELAELPWLMDFAAREGLGVAPGRAALEMLRRALSKGTPEEKIAALEAITATAADELALELRKALFASDPYLRDAAFEALWRLKAAGMGVSSTFARSS